MDWNEVFLYKQDEVYKKYMYFIEILHRDQEMEDSTRKQIIEAGIERDVSTMSLVRIWADLGNSEMRIELAGQFVNIYGAKLAHQTYSQEIIQSFRALINYLGMHKIVVDHAAWKPAYDVCKDQIERAEQVLVLNNYGEMAVKLVSLGHIEGAEKEAIVAVLKKRQAKLEDKTMKVVVGALIVRICGRDPLEHSKNGEKNEKKTGNFYKKYLITS